MSYILHASDFIVDHGYFNHNYPPFALCKNFNRKTSAANSVTSALI